MQIRKVPMTSEWRDGCIVGEYRLERLLGQGGQGMAFLARHRRLGHLVVIKLLRPDQNHPEQRARFLREGQALGMLAHPCIARLLHADTLPDGTEYLVLEHVAFGSLRERISAQKEPLSIVSVLRFLQAVAEALLHAHSHGVIHRDVKPENLLLTTDTEPSAQTPALKLIDFGLAHVLSARERAQLPWPEQQTQLDTRPGARPGTPQYCAPELGMESDTDDDAAHQRPALDAYALGVVGWELLTGVRPQCIERIDALPALRRQRPDAPAELTALIAALLSLTPQSRPDVSQVVKVCSALLARGSSTASDEQTRSQKKHALFPNRLHLSVWMFVALLTGVSCLLWVSERSQRRSAASVRTPDLRETTATPYIAITQPILGLVRDDEIEQATGIHQAPVQRIDIAPMRQLGPKLVHPDWSSWADQQAAQVRTEVVPALRRNPTPQIAYFGLAPVPLAIHLGMQLSGLVPVSVYQRDHKHGRWGFPKQEHTQEVLVQGIPADVSPSVGPVVMRVSSFVQIDPARTQEVVASPLAEIDITVKHPAPDALQSESDVLEVAAAVQHALSMIALRRPNTTVVHLFAAVPGALALRIGMQINPNIHPPIQTYQFDRELHPSYRPALLLGAVHTQNGVDVMPPVAQSVIERRLEHFVDWLKPDQETESAMAQRAHEIRDNIRKQAAADGLKVASTPAAGSFAKNTGLRRHVTGGSDIEGQDVDIPFVLPPMTESEQRISRLLDRFQGYADRAYPQRPPNKSRSKSSIKIEFTGAKLSFDLVPMLQAPEYEGDYQWLLRGDGTKRLTSVDRHNTFIKTRTNASNRTPGRVKFNECVRLLKWWREFRMNNDRNSIPGIPSLLVEMMAAHAFDQKGVQATYSETLLSWFDHLHDVVSRRTTIRFSDYQPPRGRRHAAKTPWMVIEPVDPENNLTHDWIDQNINELAEWLQRARIDMQQAVDLDRRNNHQESLHHLVRVFGSPFKHNCGG
jgi:serine/threonine protein kinase